MALPAWKSGLAEANFDPLERLSTKLPRAVRAPSGGFGPTWNWRAAICWTYSNNLHRLTASLVFVVHHDAMAFCLAAVDPGASPQAGWSLSCSHRHSACTAPLQATAFRPCSSRADI
jgi:hypothetical protein